ncbi:MAG: hypothetical protein CMJ67_03895 [Planctomycetaceae bacterium]|nr:hypothetical protein [Planctomycetaceae bacterium]
MKLQLRGHLDSGVGIEVEHDVAAMRSSVRRSRKSDLRAGDIKHGFRILSRLGKNPDRGVFLAAHAQRGDLVVLKHACRTSADGSFDRILREHEVLSGLSDAAIRPALRIHRGRDGLRTTELTMVARFVDASDLGELTETDLATVLDAAVAVSNGLAHAHECDIVHGRIEPGHILREPGGGIKLIGFGSGAKAGSNFDPGQVGTGFVAPECHLGGVATGRTDIFGLAATVWEILGDSSLEVGHEEDLDADGWLARHRSWTARLEDSNLPAELTALLARCLHPDPLRRPGFIQGVGSSLQRISHEFDRRSSMKIGLDSSSPGMADGPSSAPGSRSDRAA